MPSPTRSPSRQAPLPTWARALRALHVLLAYGAMVLALPLALVGAMAMLGALGPNLWVRLGVGGFALLLVPLLLADRLLPKDPNERRPGLVRDVLACTWSAAALVLVGLGGSLTGAPLRAEAQRLDDHGWSRAAWLGRWMAGPAPAPARALVASSEPTGAAPEDPAAPEPTPAPSDAAGEAADEPAPGEAGEGQGEQAAEDLPEGPEAAPPEPAPSREYSPAELFRNYAPAVVAIKISHGPFSSGGTGFFIDDQGTLATNHHVIDDAGEIRIKLFDGTEIAKVELLTSDPVTDLALLRVDPKALPEPIITTTLGDSEAVQVGEPVSVIGNPLGLDHTLTNGIVSARRVYEGERYIQMSAPISPGNSGGPVFDRRGRVIGVSVAQMVGGQNLNLAVPVSQLRAMIADDYPNRRGFGVSSW